jgi:hypothetical protein
MHQNLEHNLQLAHSIKSYVKHRIVCSNDIIPRSILPEFLIYLIPFYRTMLGSELVEQYIKHAEITKLIRATVAIEIKNLISIAQISTATLAVTDYGVGECQEIAMLAFNKLIADAHQHVQFICISAPKTPERKMPYMHCLILIGDDGNQLKVPCELDALNHLPEHVIALDSYLDYVGPAKNYLQDQNEYLKQYKYNDIIANDRPTTIHYENAPRIQENLDILKAHSACKKFYRHFLTLSLSSFSISELLPCHETALIQFLNDSSGLSFSWGHQDNEVSAYRYVSNSEEFEIAKNIQKKLQAGTFYQGYSQRLFVLHGINTQTELAEKIQEQYRRVP